MKETLIIAAFIIRSIVGLRSVDGADAFELEKELIRAYSDVGIETFDLDNRIAPDNYEEILAQLTECAAGNSASLHLKGVSDKGNIRNFELNFDDNGKLTVNVHSVTWRELGGGLQDSIGQFEEKYEAKDWKLTDGGYLFIQREFTAGWDGPSEQIGIRIVPLNEKFRKLNDKYAAPLGYFRCTLLTTDWDKDDFSNLDLSEAYAKLFEMENGTPLEEKYADTQVYITGDPHGGQKNIEIPKEEFEALLTKYFPIEVSAVEKYGKYAENGGYFYDPLDFDNTKGPYYEYTEVTGYEELEDGSFCLNVKGVSVQDADDAKYSSKLYIMPEPDGKWKYFRNEMIK